MVTSRILFWDPVIPHTRSCNTPHTSQPCPLSNPGVAVLVLVLVLRGLLKSGVVKTKSNWTRRTLPT